MSLNRCRLATQLQKCVTCNQQKVPPIQPQATKFPPTTGAELSPCKTAWCSKLLKHSRAQLRTGRRHARKRSAPSYVATIVSSQGTGATQPGTAPLIKMPQMTSDVNSTDCLQLRCLVLMNTAPDRSHTSCIMTRLQATASPYTLMAAACACIPMNSHHTALHRLSTRPRNSSWHLPTQLLGNSCQRAACCCKKLRAGRCCQQTLLPGVFDLLNSAGASLHQNQQVERGGEPQDC
jgi:hypothetical protein